MSIYYILIEQMRQRPDAVLLLAPGRQPLTYRRMLRQVEETVSRLRTLGVKRGDRMAVVLPQGPELAATCLAVAAGATCAPLNPTYRASEYATYFADLHPKALLVASGMDTPAVAVAKAQGIMVLDVVPHHDAGAGTFTLQSPQAVYTSQPAYAEPDDIALLLHTSGTTSRPKVVPLTHANICHSARNIQATLALSPEDRCLNVAPLFHIYGLVGILLASIVAGASVVCPPGFSAAQFFEWMAAFQPTWYATGPTVHQAILARTAQYQEVIARTPLRLIRSSSAALPPQVLAALEQVFQVPVIEAYGMTEAASQITSNPLPPRRRKPGSVGMAAGPQVGIMDAQGMLLAPGETGEVVIRGANVMQGYEDNPAANALAFTAGWLRTGDLGFLDAEGYLFLNGRIKELINRGGEKITPREVDDVLLDHPAVVQVVTFAVPHPTLGEDVAAAVVLRENASVTEGELHDFVAARLADFKAPHQVVIVDEIPKGATGKLQRIGLAEKLGLIPNQERLQLEGNSFTPRDTLELQLTKMWERILNVKPIGIKANFFELGGNSLLATELLLEINKRFSKNLALATFFQAPTIEQIASTLRREGLSLPKSLVIPLQPLGSKPPFFCHGASLAMALHVGVDQPFYGLQPHGQDGRRAPSTIENMAADYIKEIYNIQPEGPYFLGGFSFGGLVAFEMAQQLQKQGQKVALLVVIDPASPRNPVSSHPASVAVHGTPFRHENSQPFSNFVRLETRERPSLLEKVQWRLDGMKRKIKMMACKFYLGMGYCVPFPLRMFYYFEVTQLAMQEYIPSLYPGRLVFLQAEKSSLAWSEMAAEGLELHEVPGGHLELLRDPHAQVVGEKLRACLESAAQCPLELSKPTNRDEDRF